MSSIWGKNFKISVFGESHSEAIGVTIDGLPSGILVDLDEIDFEMKRRAPGNDKFSTPRKEADKPKILCGLFNGKTTGTPLCAIIENTNIKSKDYDEIKNLMRPSHSDYTGHIRYNGFNDYRGGGHFSGRLTAPIVFAGSIAKQILKTKGIFIGSHIASVKNVNDDLFDSVNLQKELLDSLLKKPFPTISDAACEKMQNEIMLAKENKNSVGGVVECGVIGIKAGVGSPIFCSVESVISSFLFSVPAVKGVEFGAGFSFSKMIGLDANDEFYIDNGVVKTKTNNSGGINGGITNGMPITLKVAIRPTPSISAIQNTVNINTLENTTLEIKGRHDPCIVQRAVPVIESGVAIAIVDLMLEGGEKFD